MKNKFLLLSTLLFSGLIGLSNSDAADSHSDHHLEHSEPSEPSKGPRQGRLLTENDFSLEITLFETGVPPEYRLYAYYQGQIVAPDQVQATVVLERLGGETNTIGFQPEGDYLLGDTEVSEPHSFKVTVSALYQGKTYRWQYDSPEGRTRISQRAAQAAGIKTEVAAPGVIHETLELFGRIELLPDQEYRIAARYPGIVQEVRVNLGDRVNAGDVLAIVENAETLQSYSLKAPAKGVIIERRVNKGDATGNKPLLILADLSRVAVDMSVFASDRARLTEGQQVTIRSIHGDTTALARIDHIANRADNNLTHVHASLANPEGHWLVGDAVRATVQIASHPVSLAVRSEAIQDFRGMTVVFAKYDEDYEVRMLETGRRNEEWTEVLGGIKPGTSYVVNNSYLVKADVLKSGASHDH